MSYLYLGILIFFSGMVTVLAKFYNNKNAVHEAAGGIYNVLYPIGAAITYGVAYCTEPGFEPTVLLYSLSYGFFYTLFTIGITGSIQHGTSSITALVKQTALVGVSIWGFLFLKVPVTVNAAIGVLLIVASLCLCLIEKSKPGEKGKKSYKLPIYLLFIAAGNIGCPLTHKYLLMRYDGKNGYMMLFFAVLISATVSAVRALKGTKKNWGKIALSSGYFPIFAGCSSAMTGIMQTLLLNQGMSTSVIYPSLAVGGLSVTLIFSIFAFKERLRPAQWCGIGIGSIALFLLNI